MMHLTLSEFPELQRAQLEDALQNDKSLQPFAGSWQLRWCFQPGSFSPGSRECMRHDVYLIGRPTSPDTLGQFLHVAARNSNIERLYPRTSSDPYDVADITLASIRFGKDSVHYTLWSNRSTWFMGRWLCKCIEWEQSHPKFGHWGLGCGLLGTHCRETWKPPDSQMAYIYRAEHSQGKIVQCHLQLQIL